MRHLPKLAILSSRFPYPLEKGDKLRLYHQIKQLSTAFRVYLFALSEEPVKESYVAQLSKYCAAVYSYQIPESRRRLNVLRTILTKRPLQVGYYTDPQLVATIQSEIERLAPDRLYCQLARMGEYATAVPVKKVLDYMDAFGVGMSRRAQVVPWYKRWVYNLEAQRMIDYEQRLHDAFDRTTIISNQDRGILALPKVDVVSNGINTRYYQPVYDRDKLYDVAFIGNMGYLPNIAAAEYLVRKVTASSDYKVLIAGARPDERVKQLAKANVTVAGWVEDIRESYASGRIFVAPLFKGTGQQNKILEAMAMGIPVVTTSEVNSAIGAEAEKEILVADTASEFRRQIKRLLNDDELAQMISNNARALVHTEYSWQTRTEQLINILLEP